MPPRTPKEQRFLRTLRQRKHLYGFLSPVPWSSSNTNNSLFRFLPYEVPDGYVPPNACQGGALSNATVHLANVSHQLPRDEPILRFKRETSVKRASNTANYSQAAIWIGALGSCNRDVDGKVYCTKPSYSNPQYNLTNVAPNSVFYTAMLPDVVHRRTILATISLNLVGYVFYFLGSIPFWFPGIYSSLCGSTKDSAQAFELAATTLSTTSMILRHADRLGP
ncbi:uncharacterized protein EI90DRAFT_190891 [Cantharellus anzutake]|uniref:uncharacterized protein n=1 Tax=Cantharellus anzutake TaxID=1750568 RepID=UPI00190838C3|nr:uncharacterized protein EI90DRAFT_190891 [Cantharellus anzutake]KAF8336552.1 hypothetical protein EI90DRAFT_190891 [Cantharellus anzutake]